MAIFDKLARMFNLGDIEGMDAEKVAELIAAKLIGMAYGEEQPSKASRPIHREVEYNGVRTGDVLTKEEIEEKFGGESPYRSNLLGNAVDGPGKKGKYRITSDFILYRAAMDPDEDEYMTQKQAAAYAGVNHKTVGRWCTGCCPTLGRLTSVWKSGHMFVIAKSDLDEFLEHRMRVLESGKAMADACITATRVWPTALIEEIRTTDTMSTSEVCRKLGVSSTWVQDRVPRNGSRLTGQNVANYLEARNHARLNGQFV